MNTCVTCYEVWNGVEHLEGCVLQTHPEQQVEEEEKVLDAVIHSHGLLFSWVAPRCRLSADWRFQQKHWDTPSGETSLLYLFPLRPDWLSPPSPLHLLLSFIVVLCPALLHPFIVPYLLSLFPLFRQMGLEKLERRENCLKGTVHQKK